MRLWHTRLIRVLCKNQLSGQWRELNSIYKLQNRHILINFVYDYPKSELYDYSIIVLSEMKKRNYRINLTNMCNYFQIFDEIIKEDIENYDKGIYKCDPYKEKMNERYFKQCYYNLQEKYDCGGISEEEWEKIENEFIDI